MSYKKWGARMAPAIALLALSLPVSADEGIDQPTCCPDNPSSSLI